MAPDGGRFSDLVTRLLTGVAVAVVGLAAVWAGYPWFTVLVAAVVGRFATRKRRFGAVPA